MTNMPHTETLLCENAVSVYSSTVRWLTSLCRAPLPRNASARLTSPATFQVPNLSRGIFHMDLMGRGAPGQKVAPFVSIDLRKFASGKECQMRSEWCNRDSATVVLCHSRRHTGTGKAQKPHDFWAYHGCSECHANEHYLSDTALYGAIWRTQCAVYAHFGTLTP